MHHQASPSRLRWAPQGARSLTRIRLPSPPSASPCGVQAGGLRVRQHVNPLKKELQVPTDPPTWGEAFAQPQRPLVLDIGCGYGRFLLALRWVGRGGGARAGAQLARRGMDGC
jgi:hypothetical protein